MGQVQERIELFRDLADAHRESIQEIRAGLPRTMRTQTADLIAAFLFYNGISQDKDKQVLREIEFTQILIEKSIPLNMEYYSPAIKSGAFGNVTFNQIKVASSLVLNGVTELVGYEERFECLKALKEYLAYLIKFQKDHANDKMKRADFHMKIDTTREWKFINDFAKAKLWIDGVILKDEKVDWIEKSGTLSLGHFIDAITEYVMAELMSRII